MKRKQLGWWLVHVLTAATVGAAFFLQIQLSPGDTERVRLWHFDMSRYSFWVAIGIGCAIAAWGVQTVYAARAARRAEEVQHRLVAEAIGLGTAVLGPVMLLAGLLGELCDLQGPSRLARAEKLGRAKVTVLEGLLSVFPREVRPRACFFHLEGTTPTRSLVLSESRGRLHTRQAVLAEGTASVDEALQALDANQVRYWHLGHPGDPPPGWGGAKDYQAFISVPVATKGTVHGMLTVDAETSNAFAEPTDLQTVEAIARLYAAVLALA